MAKISRQLTQDAQTAIDPGKGSGSHSKVADRAIGPSGVYSRKSKERGREALKELIRSVKGC